MGRNAEATVVVLGLAFNKHCEPPGGGPTVGNDYCEREGTDRAVIELPKGQASLVKALRAANPSRPLVAVLVHGGTISFDDDLMQALDAIVDAWQPGIMGAEAVAGALFGDFSPAGRTATTWYRSTSQLPPLGHMGLYPNRSMGTHGITYRYFDSKSGGNVQFPFGFGLSYTTFSYEGIRLRTTRVSACDIIDLEVDVKNTGMIDSDEVVQVYLQQPDATVPAPHVRLGAFERVHVAVGETVTVKLSIPPETHAVVLNGDVSGNEIYTAGDSQVVQAERLQLFAGGGQPEHFSGGLSAAVQIVDSAPLVTCSRHTERKAVGATLSV